MTKSLPIVGIAICATLAAFAGANASAHKAHPRKLHRTTTTSTRPPLRAPEPDRSRSAAGPRSIDPIYDSCENPWRHLEVGCPYGW